MHIDLVLATLLILLGAQVAYIADEIVGLSPRVATWLERHVD